MSVDPATTAQAPPATPAAAPPRSTPPPTAPPAEPPRPGFAETTSRIVRQAASILEEEIAAGVVAAKEVEKRFIDVDTLRSGDPGEVIQRFRKDTHEVVDILLDLAHAATRSLGDVAGRAVRLRPAGMGTQRGESAPNAMGAGGMPTLMIPATVAPGGTSEVMLSVENDTESPTATFEFHSTDLIDQDGNRIAAKHVSFSSRSLSVGAHQTEKVGIRVAVPVGTPAGRYSGMLQASRMDHLRAILLIDIG